MDGNIHRRNGSGWYERVTYVCDSAHEIEDMNRIYTTTAQPLESVHTNIHIYMTTL